MKKNPKYLLHSGDLGLRFSEMGRRLRTVPATLRPVLIRQYKELQEWLRMLNTVKKWKPVQIAYDKAYGAACAEGYSPKHAHLQAKCAVQNEFPWVHERDLGKDLGRGIAPYD